jgi:hypothetical protein
MMMLIEELINLAIEQIDTVILGSFSLVHSTE